MFTSKEKIPQPSLALTSRTALTFLVLWVDSEGFTSHIEGDVHALDHQIRDVDDTQDGSRRGNCLAADGLFGRVAAGGGILEGEVHCLGLVDGRGLAFLTGRRR